MKKRQRIIALTLCCIALIAVCAVLVFSNDMRTEGPEIVEYITYSDSQGYYTIDFVKYENENSYALKKVYVKSPDAIESLSIDLTNIVVEDGGKPLTIDRIESAAFGEETVKRLLSEIILHESITKIEDETFKNCNMLKKINLSNVTYIGKSAFSRTNIKYADLRSAETIGDSAFSPNTNLYMVKTGKNLTSIGDNAFKDCGNLKYFSVGFPRSQAEIGKDVFLGCGAPGVLQILIDEGAGAEWLFCAGLTLSGEWTDVRDEASHFCVDSGDVSVLNHASGNVFGDQSGEDRQVVYGSNGLGYYLYRDQEGFKAEVVSYSTFEDADVSGKVLTLPQTVIYAGEAYSVTKIRALEKEGDGTAAIQSIYISPTVKHINVNAFSKVFSKGLEIYMPATPDLNDKDKLNEIPVYDKDGNKQDLKDIWTDYKVVCTWGTDSSTNKAAHIYVNYPLDDYQKDLQGIFYYLDKGLGYAVVGDYSNGDDTNANTSKYVGSGAYSGETGHAVLPDYVSDGSRYYKVVGLGRYAFYNCSTLEKITFGAFVGDDVDGLDDTTKANISVGDCTFRNSTKLRTFAIDSQNTKYGVDDSGQLLFALAKAGDVYAPTKIVKAGIDLESVIGISDKTSTYNSVSVIEKYAFANCTKLKEFDFGCIKNIGEHAFENTGLENLTLPENINIEDYAFSNCARLTSVEIDSIKAMGRFVFKNCTALENIKLKTAGKYYTKDGVLFELVNNEYAILLHYPAVRYGVTSFTVNKLERKSGGELPIREIEAYAFEHTSLSSIVVGDSVWVIGKAAFSNCGQLREVKIGKEVYCIGAEIQSRQDKGSTQYSGYVSQIAANQDSFDVSMIKCYEREVFDNCGVLSNISVDEKNRYYLSDNNGILYNKEKTTLFVYPEGVSRVSYTVPTSVTKVGIEAFENNVHIKRLTLPEGVVEIGAKAFNGCVNLSMLYMRCLDAPKIGEQVFNSAGSLSQEEKLTVYCIPEPAVWLQKHAELWDINDVPVEKYEAIQAIPEQALPTPEIYVLHIMDSDGNYLPGLKVTTNCTGKDGDTKSVLVNSNGYAVITLPTDESVLKENNYKISLTIEDETGTYYSYINKSYYLDKITGFSHIIMQEKSGASGVSCNGEDISVGKVSVNTISNIKKDSKDQVIEKTPIEVCVSIRIDEKNTQASFIVEPHILLTMISDRGEVKTISYTATGAELIEQGKLSGIYKFSIDPDEKNVASHRDGFTVESYKYEIVYQTKLETKDYTDAIIEKISRELNIDLFYFDFKDFDLSIGKTLRFEDNFPLLGGMEWEFEVGDENDNFIHLMPRGSKLYVGLGTNFTSFDFQHLTGIRGRDPYDEYSSAVHMETEFDLPVDNSNKKPIHFDVKGIAEFEMTSLNSPLKIVRSSVTLALGVYVEDDIPVTIVCVPVCIGFEIEGQLGVRLTIAMPDEGNKGQLVVPELIFSLDVEARLGLGNEILSAGIYGEAEIDLVLDLMAPAVDILKYFYVEFNFGLYARISIGLGPFDISHTFYLSIADLAGWDISYEYKRPDVAASPYVLTSVETGQRFASFEEAIAFTASQFDLSFSTSEEFYDQYGRIDPVVVTYEDELYMFYIDNVFVSKNANYKDVGVQYDEYNYLKLVWSKYDPSLGWSAPQIVNKDINNEVSFDICVNEDGIHILLQRMNMAMDADNVSSHLYAYGVYAVTFDGVGPSRLCRLDDGNGFTSMLEISSMDEQVYATWISNTNYEITGLVNGSTVTSRAGEANSDKSKANILYCCIMENVGEWKNIHVVRDLPLLVDVEFAEYGESNLLLVIQDQDCNYSTINGTVRVNETEIEDRGLYYIDLNGESSNLVKMNLATTEISEPDSLLSVRNTKAGILLSTVHDVRLINKGASGMTHRVVLNESLPVYEVVYYNGELYGVVYPVFEDLNKAKLYMRLWTDNSFTDGICIKEYENETLSSYAMYYWGNELFVIDVTTHMDVGTGTDTAVTKYNNALTASKIVKKDDLVLQDVWYDRNGLHLAIFNDSLTTIHTLQVKIVSCDNHEQDVTVTGLNILPGQATTVVCKDFELNKNKDTIFVNEKEVTKEYYSTGYLVAIENPEGTEEDLTNNRIENIPLVFADIKVDARYIDVADVKYLLVIVKNEGELPASFSMFVENGIVPIDAEAHKYLYQYQFGGLDENGDVIELAPGAYKYFTIELNKVYFVEDYVTVSVFTDSQERNTENNIMSFSMEKNEVVEFGETHTVHYYLDDVLILKVDYRVGETVDHSVVEKYEFMEGYEFKGWSNLVTTMPAHDVCVYGYFRENSYTVNYYVDGEIKDSKQVEYGSVIPEMDILLMGHTFSGWFMDEACTMLFLGGVMPAETLNLYGYQTKNTYRVTFYLNNKPYQTVSYEYGQTIEIPNYQEQKGHEFIPWTIPNGLTTMPAYDLTLYATDRIKTYTLIYMLDEGNGYGEKQRITVQYGQTIPYYEYSAPSGYAFSGWMDRMENGNLIKVDTNLKMPDQNLYLYGKIHRKEYTVWYYVDGSQVHSQRVVYGEKVPVYTYEANGFQFDGWINPVTVMPDHDVMVYGNVSAERFAIKYYVDGKLTYVDEYECGAAIQIRTLAEKEGYSFSGWNECYDSDDRVIKNIPEKMPSYDLHVYGVYTLNEYTVYYYVDSVFWRSESVKYDEPIQVLTYIPKEGFSFSGFSVAPDKMPANDVYLFGVTQRNAYKLSYYVDGEEKYVETVLFGSFIPPYAYDVPRGHVISAWKNLPQQMPAKDVRVDATLSKLIYQIHYYVDGRRKEIVEYAFGDPVNAYEYSPEKGYRFTGFVNEPETMPDRDIQVYGVTEKELFTVYYYIGDGLVFQDQYAFDDMIILREAPLLEGYSFNGWNEVPRRMGDADIHVYGNYVPNEYVLSYVVNGKTVFTKNYAYGSAITSYSAEPVEGYTFMGWINEPQTMPCHDVQVVGQLERNMYKVCYYVDDVLLKSEMLPYGSEVDLSFAETDHYTVTEWKMDGVSIQTLTMQSKDIRLDATFVEKKVEKKFSFAWVLPVTIAAVVVVVASAGIVVFRRSRGRSGR